MPILYLDYMSQPSRACAIFIKLNSLPVELSQVFIHKGQTKSKEYRSKNPMGKVPLLEDGPLLLPESAAILTYLAGEYSAPEHWYPRSSTKARAPVEAALHWYHNNIRAGCMRLVFNTVIAPRLGMTCNKAYADEGQEILQLALKQMDAYWLQGGSRPFMTGSQICLADLLCCCELEQLTMMNRAKHGTDLEDQLHNHLPVKQWMARVQEACAPAYEEVHTMLRKAAAVSSGKTSSKM